MQKIRKAVIPAAGLGTRFLPATKAMAKEMMPVMDKPVIQFIVEEVVKSGIEEILIITGRNKRSIEDHFDANYELEENLIAKQKEDLLAMVQETTLANVQFKRQHYPNGLGDAIYQAKSFVGDEPFLLTLGDNIMGSDVPASKQVIQIAEEHNATAILTQEVDSEAAKYYGIVEEVEALKDHVFKINGLVEKPTDYRANPKAICGRYVLTPDIFDAIEKVGRNPHSGEVELTDALNLLAKTQPVLSAHYEGNWYEVGEPLGLVKASIQYALAHPEVKKEFKAYLKDQVIPALKRGEES
ncbi:UTP--glucose-1-phosphate uridylyltransferase [Aerococcus christensenii]|uniref:UTP--glucose-1-phosphate uridylyltransferase n=1 Tax=Aerococcus christensenii TaxID=87541 RepID=A0A2I1K822_9LACT|nr:UTP--glucose-1-phosphate uridylyltransferase [Aerococcus christensenii]PKY91790.1 UTP--glucose-1-phosphate uridylyltransferase [Aerococcus christensenii]